MEYGDVLIKYTWRTWSLRWCNRPQCFRFRVDPVPFTGGDGKRTHFRLYYKTPNHMNEKRQFFACDDPTLVRGKRRVRSLPEPYDDRTRSDVYLKKSWKKNHKVRKQWMKHIVG